MRGEPTTSADVVEPAVAIGVGHDRRGWVGPALLFLALALVPVAAHAAGQGYILSFATRTVVLGLAALSLDLLIGIGGLVSFGHAAYLGIGAYAVGILSEAGITDAFAHAAVAAAASALFALVTGAIALRTSGVYFIMITLAFGQMLFFLATALSAYGGDDGMTLAARSTLFGRAALVSDTSLYVAALLCLGLAYLACRRLAASPFGRVLAGTRENRLRMEAIGIRPYPFRLAAYVIAAMLAGLAGALLANLTGFVSPAVMTWQRSGELIFTVVLGGVGTLHGPILGAIVFLLGEEVLAGLTDRWRLLFGPLLILVVLFARGGLVNLGRGRP